MDIKLTLTSLNKSVASFSGETVGTKEVSYGYGADNKKNVDIKAATSSIAVSVWEDMGRPNEIIITTEDA